MKGGNSDRAPKAGRPRDEATGPTLLAVVRRLVVRHGYGGVSIQSIIAEAGVARQTLYRRWPSKADLVLDAFLESAAQIPIPAGGSVTERLTGFLGGLFETLRRDGPAIRSLIASAQSDPGFLASFRARFVEPRADVVARFLRDAQQAGDLDPGGDVEAAVDACHGAFWYRLLLGADLDDAYAARLARLVVASLSG